MTLFSKNSLAEAALRLDGLFFSDGQLKTRLWARLNPAAGERLAANYAYNAQGQLSGIDYADDTPDVTYTYNNFGQPLTITDGTGTRTYDYDPATFALTAENYISGIHAGSSLHRAYDVHNRPIGYALVAPTAESENPGVVTAASYSYDSHGRLNTVSGDTIPAGLNLNAERNTLNATTFSYARLANSDLIESVDGPVHKVLNAYEPNRDVLTVKTNQLNTDGIVSRYAYTYDSLARRTTRTQSGNAFDGIGYAPGTELPATMTGTPGSGTSTDTFSYNPRSEVTGSINDKDASLDRGYVYDPIGNRLSAAELNISKEYDSNALNQYTAIRTSEQSVPPAVNNPAYDADGNMITDGEGKTYTWDAENRLIAVTLPNGEIVKYTYDAGSHRVKREHLSAGNVEATLYAYDGWNVIAEKILLNSSFLNLKCYTWGLDLSNTLQGAGGVEGLLRMSVVGTDEKVPEHGKYFYAYDANGNVSESLHELGAYEHYEYDPFGKLAKGSFAGVNRIGFSTKQIEPITGLYYYGYRFYDPNAGGWINRDSVEEEGGWNLYSISQNNVINLIDLLGLMTTTCCCDEMDDGEKKLREIYKNISKELERNKIPKGAGGEYCCANVNNALAESFNPIPKCWKCRLERRYTSFLGMFNLPWGILNTGRGIYDHWFVVCDGACDGKKRKTLVFDYWKDKGGEECYEEFRNKYTNKDDKNTAHIPPGGGRGQGAPDQGMEDRVKRGIGRILTR